MAGFLESSIVSLLERGLNTASLRHQVIADNLANVDTPGYKRKEIAFEDELTAALLRDKQKMAGVAHHPKHIPIDNLSLDNVKPQILEQSSEIYRNDQNNVDVEQEMARLAKNSLLMEAMLTRVSSKLSGLKNTIREVR